VLPQKVALHEEIDRCALQKGSPSFFPFEKRKKICADAAHARTHD
jgi:hypothetical protein